VVVVLVGVLGLVFDWGASSTTTTRVVNETPQGFLAVFVRAEHSGDGSFLLARLDPVVLGRYGSAQCQAAVARLTDPSAALRLVSVSGPAPYVYSTDGHSATIPNTYTLHVTGTDNYQAVTRDVHFALVHHTFRFFTDCGQPLAGAP
jgi:hypothetical protein